MPRDDDKDNRRSSGPKRDARGGGRDRPGGGPRSRDGGDQRRARSSAAPRGERKFSDKKFGDKKIGDKKFGDKRPFKARGDRPDRPFKPREDRGDRPFKPREDRGDRPFKPRGDRPFTPREDRGERSFKPREDRGERPARAPRGEFRSRDGGDERRPFKPRVGGGDRPFTPRPDRGDRPFKPREDRGDRPFKPREDRGERTFKPRGDGPFTPRDDRGGDKPWVKRERPAARDGERRFDKPRGDRPFKPREDRGDRPFKPREDRGDRPFKPREDRGERSFKPREDRPRFDRPREERSDRSPRKFDRPRQRDDAAPRARSDWQEHPRSEDRGESRERPRRDNEDDTKIFAKRPAFGGRGAYRERPARDDDRRRPREDLAPPKKKSGDRIAKLMARVGLASRRDAEEWVMQGRVTVNGRVITSPALDVTANDKVLVDGKPLPERERTRLFLYHKPKGLMTTHDDPEGRPTVFEHLPEGLPRLISVGRLDFNTEGLLLLTNDGGLARTLELPDTGWLRRYRVRAHGDVTQAQLDALKDGIEVDGVKYGAIDATLERDQGANVWITFAIREGKNREVRNVLAHLGLEVNRLIRISYGPFQLGEIAEGQAEEVRTRMLRDQLGMRIAQRAGVEFDVAEAQEPSGGDDAPREKRPFKPRGQSGLVEDRKGRRILVQRAGSEGSRERKEIEAGFGPPKRPKRNYHGKRDFKPRDE